VTVRTTFEQRSKLSVSAAALWAHVTTAQGINDELFPWLRMTVPEPLRDRSIDQVPLGRYLGRSWLLALGVLPIDFDDITLAEVGPGFRFKETSRMLGFSIWVHERTILDINGGCEVHDKLTFELSSLTQRLPGWSKLAMATLKLLFRHRHARLSRWVAAHSGRST
jgi:ligand-binding SRPBCC domain-containing protein